MSVDDGAGGCFALVEGGEDIAVTVRHPQFPRQCHAFLLGVGLHGAGSIRTDVRRCGCCDI